MKTILITGACGFVGSNLSAYLAKASYRLWALDQQEKENTAYTRFFSWNELDIIPWQEVDAIIHLAGKAHDTKNQSEARAYFDINTGLTQRIYDCFLASPVRAFVFFSSVKAAADSVNGVLTEAVIPRPVGPYGESKIEAEKYIQQRMPEEKSVYIVRPCMIHGPGNKGNLNLLYQVVKRGIPWPLGAFENRRSFASVDNVCYMINQLLTSKAASGVYHIGDDDALSTNELIETMCEAMGKKARIWRLPKGGMTAVAKIGSLLGLPLNSERLRKLTEDYVVSNNKIKQAIGIDALPVTAKEGLIKTVRSFARK